MTEPSDAAARGRLAGLRPPARWAVLLVLSVALAALFETIRIPAALLLGPLIAGILVASNGATLRVPPLPYLAAQSMVGLMIARAITSDIVLTFLGGWPLFLGVVAAIIAAGSLMGWLMSRWHVLPGTTAVWGASPGAATPMMLMAEAFGADARLVALMQYLRVVFVAITASVIARFWLNPSGGGPPAAQWFHTIDWLAFLETLAVAAFGAFLGRRLRIPAGGFLVPLALGTVLHVFGVLPIELPEWLLAVSYALLGWNVGLGFTRPILVHAIRKLPVIALSNLIMIAFCGGLAFLLAQVFGIDPLTAYLATSPGGIDSVAIIAASAKVDVPFVMALQTFRLLVVLVVGPSLAKVVARSTARPYR